MQPKLKIKPAMGLKVRDPKSLQHVPEQGLEVERSLYWIRRLEAGDVVVANSEGVVNMVSPAAMDEILEQEKPAKKLKPKLEESN